MSEHKLTTSEPGSGSQALQDYLQQRKSSIGHVSWGPGAAGMTQDERDAYLLQVLQKSNAERADAVPVPVVDLVQIADALHGLSRLGQASVHEWLTMPESEKQLRLQIRELLGMSNNLAEQCLPEALQRSRRQQRLANRDATGRTIPQP